MELEGWLRWRDAMQNALYGPDGFYLRPGAPPENFRTAAHVGRTWNQVIAELAQRVDVALGEPDDFAVVDIGAGGGELIGGLGAVAPERWSLIGVDLAPRPPDLSPRVRWLHAPPAETTGLLLAIEWLDVVPVDVVALTANGPRYVETRRDGAERYGDQLTDDDLAWLNRWWPLHDIGDRAELGPPRDDSWAAARSRLTAGLALMVDYAVRPDIDLSGTVTGYADGMQVAAIPDGSGDLTAHVLVESLVVPGDLVLHQYEALRRLGLSAERPVYRGHPASYLDQMAAAGEASELLDRLGLGGFTWLLHGRGCDPAALLERE